MRTALKECAVYVRAIRATLITVIGARFNREEGYSICHRLEGFGLVHEMEQTRELPLADYVFRLSLYGVRLLKLLGEEVPNYEYYTHREIGH